MSVSCILFLHLQQLTKIKKKKKNCYVDSNDFCFFNWISMYRFRASVKSKQSRNSLINRHYTLGFIHICSARSDPTRFCGRVQRVFECLSCHSRTSLRGTMHPFCRRTSGTGQYWRNCWDIDLSDRCHDHCRVDRCSRRFHVYYKPHYNQSKKEIITIDRRYHFLHVCHTR